MGVSVSTGASRRVLSVLSFLLCGHILCAVAASVTRSVIVLLLH